MAYEILTSTSLKDYIKNTASLEQHLEDEDWQISEIGDGNLNLVFLVQSKQNNLIIKQAVPYLRCVGESWKLSRDRMLFETAALKKFYEITPQHIPRLYHVDADMSLVAMQYLDNHIIVRKGIIASIKYPYLAEHVSNFLANTLFKTSSFYLSSSDKRNLEKEFSDNNDLCKLTEEVIFTFPYIDHSSNMTFPGMQKFAKQITNNHKVKHNILDLKYCFMNQRDALLHADLHTGSMMSNGDETVIIDPEFAFCGPFGFDVGSFLANLILAYVSHNVCDIDDDYSLWILQTITDFYQKFEDKFVQLWRKQTESALLVDQFLPDAEIEFYRRRVLLTILQESIGFAGCKILRRILGLAGVADIRDIKDPSKRLLAEQLSFKIGTACVENYKNITSFSQLIAMIKAYG